MSWTVVFSSDKPHIIEIAKNLLNENSIKFVTVDKRDSMYTAFLDPAIELYVQGVDVMISKQLLRRIEIE